MALRRFLVGLDTLAPFLIGLLIIWILCQRKKLSFQEVVNQMTLQLKAAGLSDRAAAYWVAVSRWETADFQSTLATDYNNYFGMKWAKSEGVPAVNYHGSSWANPPDLAGSVSVQLGYMGRFNYPRDFKSIEQLVSFMKANGYFEEPEAEYLNGVKSKLQ